MAYTDGHLAVIDTSRGDFTTFEKVPSVCVLMSIYNGDRYLKEQIESIAAQKGARVTLRIRDDGSSDKSAETARTIAFAEGLPCLIDAGPNIGFLGSFEDILLGAEGFGYYAFSDQDDIWRPEKLAKAIDALKDAGDEPALYASSVVITDGELKQISRNDFPGFVYSIPSEFVRHRLAGHTMVWNEALQANIRKVGRLSVWSHDQHVVLLGLMSSATLFLDSASYVKHRRLPESITPGGRSPLKRVRHEMAMMLDNSGKFDRVALASELLNLKGFQLSTNDEAFLELVVSSRQSISDRFELVLSSRLTCGLGIGDLEARASILLGRF